MPEIRINPFSGQGVIIAGERSKRPFTNANATVSPSFSCPFCFGNEDETPRTLDEEDYPDQPGRWAVRSVQNRYAALSPTSNPWYETDFELNLADLPSESGLDGALEKQDFSLQWKREDGNGWHEVIIESPDHVTNCGILDARQWQRLVLFYARRMANAFSDERWKYVQLFKNQGAQAGASITHIHSQLLAMPLTPPFVMSEYRRLKRLNESGLPCVWCAVIKTELEMKIRIVTVTDHFIVLCPFASTFAGETWIIPREHLSRFDQTPEPQLRELGSLLAKLLGRIEGILPSPSYNIVYRTAPRIDGAFPDLFHWRLEITPRINGIAGFEIGTGLFINTIVPEDFVKRLRWDDSFSD